MRLEQLTDRQKRRIRVARLNNADVAAIATLVYNTPEEVENWVLKGRSDLWGEGPPSKEFEDFSLEAQFVLDCWDMEQDEVDLALTHLTGIIMGPDKIGSTNAIGSKNSASSALIRLSQNLERVYQDKPPILSDADGYTLD